MNPLVLIPSRNSWDRPKLINRELIRTVEQIDCNGPHLRIKLFSTDTRFPDNGDSILAPDPDGKLWNELAYPATEYHYPASGPYADALREELHRSKGKTNEPPRNA